MFLVNEDILGCYMWVWGLVPQKQYLYFIFYDLMRVKNEASIKDDMAGHKENYVIHL